MREKNKELLLTQLKAATLNDIEYWEKVLEVFSLEEVKEMRKFVSKRKKVKTQIIRLSEFQRHQAEVESINLEMKIEENGFDLWTDEKEESFMFLAQMLDL